MSWVMEAERRAAGNYQRTVCANRTPPHYVILRAQRKREREAREAVRKAKAAARRAAVLAARVADPAKARALLYAAAERLGVHLADLVMPQRPGRQTNREQARYDGLARCVFEARVAGATIAALVDVLWRDERRVFELAARGKALALAHS